MFNNSNIVNIESWLLSQPPTTTCPDKDSYDNKSDEGSNWVRQGDESESGQIVLKQVKWSFFDANAVQLELPAYKNQAAGK